LGAFIIYCDSNSYCREDIRIPLGVRKIRQYQRIFNLYLQYLQFQFYDMDAKG